MTDVGSEQLLPEVGSEQFSGAAMDLLKYDGKYVCVKDIYGETYMGRASYGGADFLECEYGGEEDGIFIEDSLIYNSQTETIEEIVPHGTAELWTEHLVLRRYRPEDAEALYEHFGTDPDMYKYYGWNPYATLEAAQETVQRFIDSYDREQACDDSPACGCDEDSTSADDHDRERDRTSADDHDRDSDRTYSWVMDVDGVVVGTIGAYDYKADYDASQIEVG